MFYKKPVFWAAVVCLVIAVLMTLISAKTPELPEAASVLSMEMVQFNENASLGAVTITDGDQIAAVIYALSGAGKTLRQSVNDYPTENNYLIVRFKLPGERERRTLYLYSEDNLYYIEEPYVGIYRSSRDSSVAIYKIYTGSVKNREVFTE